MGGQLKKSDEDLLNSIAQKRDYFARERPGWRKRNSEELSFRRSKMKSYGVLAEKVEAHFPQFDELVRNFNEKFREYSLFPNDLQLVEVDLGEHIGLTTVFEQRRYVVEDGNAHLKIEFIPEDDFFRDGVLFTHRIHLHNSSWFPQEWPTTLDLPLSLELLNENHLGTYAVILKQFKKRIDLLRDYLDQDSVISKMCFDRAAEIIESKLTSEKVLQGSFEDFNSYGRDCLQGNVGSLSSIILSPPLYDCASFSVGPADSKRSKLYFGLNMEEYDTMTEDGRNKLSALIDLMIVLTNDNLSWSTKRNVYNLQYDGW